MTSRIDRADKPKVSVVLPAYNAERFIGAAIESILGQSFSDFELIVVDDCSRDDTWHLVQGYAKADGRVVAIRNDRNLNLAQTLNRGIALAQGEYVFRMDHDDISMPNRLERQVQFLDANPDVGIVGSSMQIIDEQGQIVGMRKYNLTDEVIRRNIFLYSPFCHPAIAIRASILKLAGLYNHEFNPAEDYELYFRIGVHSRFANLDEVLLKYRVVKGTSMTTSGTRELERKTILVRRKYSCCPPYRMSAIDRAYNLAHYLSLFLVPSSLKRWLFSKVRDT